MTAQATIASALVMCLISRLGWAAAEATAYSGFNALQEITVTARLVELLGTAIAASEGTIADQELQLTPQYRPGQLLETVPGLIVTLHSP